MKKINVVGAIILDNQQILCAKRGLEKNLGGLWEFPGGKIESHETPRMALERELDEELLINVTINDEPFEQTKYLYEFGEVTLTTFLCQLASPEMTLTEHEEVRWLHPFELDSLQWAPADIPAVNKLKRLGNQLWNS